MSRYYTINQTKLAEVVRIVREHQPVAVESVEAFALGDWPEGTEHQDWLNTATADEIADWFIAGYEPELDMNIDRDDVL